MNDLKLLWVGKKVAIGLNRLWAGIKLTDWCKAGNFATALITRLIAALVLIFVIGLLVNLDDNNVAVIAILAGIAGSAATFLFAPKSNT